MKIHHPDPNHTLPLITNVQTYESAYHQYALMDKRAEEARRNKKSNALQLNRDATRYNFLLRRYNLPYVLVAICPFTKKSIWYKTGLFSLRDAFWYSQHSNGRVVAPESESPHLFCVDGALSLNGHQPTETKNIRFVHKQITMAAEVPFIKPRVLSIPTMLAVIHSFPIAEKYTAYTTTYFAKELPKQDDFCVPWAKEMYVDFWDKSREVTYTGKREDAQEYDLAPWLAQKKIMWLDPNTEDRLLTIDDAPFPYHNVPGRKHPYIIENGQVIDLPNPIQGEAKFDLER